MALIKCKNCGHDVSDKAARCPHCGTLVNNKIACERLDDVSEMTKEDSSKSEHHITNEKSKIECTNNGNSETREAVAISNILQGKSKIIYGIIGAALVLLIGGTVIYISSSSKVKDFSDKPLEVIVKAAKKGTAAAQSELGFHYFQGNSIPQDYDEAVKWFWEAAKQGDAAGEYGLGICYYYGKGISQNNKEAAKWIKKAAEQGLKDAQYDIGLCYEFGIGTYQSYDEACKWYRNAAEQGNADAKKALMRLGK
ncbi:MAG: zinc-ribbon domain-containing protein [Prevotella sp.]|nr:zinc-ribbon domain-containing protein [Prevotella sp.]